MTSHSADVDSWQDAVGQDPGDAWASDGDRRLVMALIVFWVLLAAFAAVVITTALVLVG